MSKADRRARKRENKLQGRAERDAAVKRRKQRSGLVRGAIAAVVIVAVFALIIATGHKSSKKTALPAGCVATKPPAAKPGTYKTAPPMTIDVTKTYTALMSTTCGDVTIALDPREAPKTVNNFVFLARHHFYDGLTFHRVAKDFVVQGGDPTGNGDGGPGYDLPTEPPKRGYTGGDVAMAKGTSTSGSQFFLTWSAAGAKNLGGPPYPYSILGHVTKGLGAVSKMGSLAPVSGDGPPKRPLYIFKVSITES